jgi:hypothetical protein
MTPREFQEKISNVLNSTKAYREMEKVILLIYPEIKEFDNLDSFAHELEEFIVDWAIEKSKEKYD